MTPAVNESSDEAIELDRGALSRRGFLALGAGALGVAATGTLGLRLFQGDDGADQNTAVASPPTVDEATVAVGQRYIDATPAEADAASLRSVLPAALASISVGAHTDGVDRAVRDDFENDATIELDGWLLSLTECRLAALAVIA